MQPIHDAGKKPTSSKIKGLQVVAVSDTHGNYKKLEPLLSKAGDIFIHAGDFTYYGQEKSFRKFFDFLDKLPYRYKVVVSGNHEISLDNGCIAPNKLKAYLSKYPCTIPRGQLIAELKKRCIYLEHQYIEIEGLKIFASPYTPYYCGSAFQYPLIHEKAIWAAIPENLDLLITHGPPWNILDSNDKNNHGGSQQLRQMVLSKSPRCHVFGHIHEANGMMKVGQTMFLNVAIEPTRLQL